MKNFSNPSAHPDWLQPHSKEWYHQLGKFVSKYLYPWHSILEEPNGESIFDAEVMQRVESKAVLDIGCGHGDFTIQCGKIAKKVIGFDNSDSFIKNGNKTKKQNVSFVIGDIKNGLPFQADEFDFAYIRKGPTSAYPLLGEVVKSGGEVFGLHPGDKNGCELVYLFPDLFQPNSQKIKARVEERLRKSRYQEVSIEEINSLEYFQSPDDILRLCCFGQKETVYRDLEEEYSTDIRRIFVQYATSKGLPVTSSRYIVRAIV
jgi:SAM-dependent methyltransferase